MKVGRQYADTIPELERIDNSESSSLYVGVYQDRYFERSWHHHPEYELILITHGQGRRLVGDHSEMFTAGDLVLMGTQLPHAWISDRDYKEPESDTFSRSIYVQFKETLFESGFQGISEFQGISKLLLNSRRGMKVGGRNKDRVVEIMTSLPEAEPVDRLLTLVKMLDLIMGSFYKLLASEGYLSEKIYFKSKRMTRIHQFLVEQFRDELTLLEVAELVNMTRTSFCRFFKSQTGSTFTEYLNRIRIDFARKLLRNTEMQIKEIGYECGFTSISYFNHTFKRITGTSPRLYRTG